MEPSKINLYKDLCKELIKYFSYFKELGYLWLPKSKFSFLFNEKETINTEKEGLKNLLKRISYCQNCSLYQTRTNVVLEKKIFSKDLMLIGDFPSKEDDFTGIPFSGALREILQKMLNSVELKRENFYITFLVKCKPPAERLPNEEEINTCKQYLLQEIELLKPKLILAFGDLTAKFLLDKPVSISSFKNKPFKYKNSIIIFTYHPNHMLKNSQVKKNIWEDLKIFKKLYDWVLKNQNG